MLLVVFKVAIIFLWFGPGGYTTDVAVFTLHRPSASPTELVLDSSARLSFSYSQQPHGRLILECAVAVLIPVLLFLSYDITN